MKSKWSSLLPVIARYLLGVVFFLSGLAGLLQLAPPPKDLPEAMMSFFTAINNTGFFIPVLKLTETITGLMLIVRIAPALALVILAPVSIQIFLVHAFLTPGIQNLILPIVIIVLHLLAARAYWSHYRPLFGRN